jgi:predicted transcriptional regulator
METLAIDKNIITYREAQYTLNGYEVIDSACLHLFLDEGVYAVVLPCIVNTEVIFTMDNLTVLLT